MAMFVLFYEIENNKFCLTIAPMRSTGFFESFTVDFDESRIYYERIKGIVNILREVGIECALENMHLDDIENYKLSVMLSDKNIIPLLEETHKIMREMASWSDPHYRKGITREEIQGIINKIKEINSVHANEIAGNLERHFNNLLQPSSSCRIS